MRASSVNTDPCIQEVQDMKHLRSMYVVDTAFCT